jgi:hypothetical protein
MIKHFEHFNQIVNFKEYLSFGVLNLLMYVKTKQQLHPGFISLRPFK